MLNDDRKSFILRAHSLYMHKHTQKMKLTTQKSLVLAGKWEAFGVGLFS